MLMMAGHGLWMATGWTWAMRMAVASLVWVGVAILILAVSHWWCYRKVTPKRYRGESEEQR